MIRLVFIGFLMLGIAIGWLVVYFVRKYQKYDAKTLQGTAMLFFGVGFLDSLLFFVGQEVGLVSLMAYIIGASTGLFLHWIYQFIVAKMAAPKFMDPRSKYNLFSGCNLPAEEKNRNSQVVYLLECIGKGYEQLRRGLITEDEFKGLVKNTGLSNKIFKVLIDGYWGDMFISPDLAAYIQAKHLLDDE